MKITEYLSFMDDHDIDLWIDGSEIYTGMECLIELPELCETKEKLRKRLINNEFMRSRQWLTGNFGELYAYQYSKNGHIFIDRQLDESVDIYRCQFNKDGKAINIKGIHEGIPFSEAYQKAQAFLNWFYTNNSDLKKGRY